KCGAIPGYATPRKGITFVCVAQIYVYYNLFANENYKIKLTYCFIATYSLPEPHIALLYTIKPNAIPNSCYFYKALSC
ncbi:hypothetical protein, partial [Sphingobacterium sp.]|uniref:hypothetical protein n=1 Tax=Sphingobacterium sp. TaxID=341027 RepID=UPI00289F1C05